MTKTALWLITETIYNLSGIAFFLLLFFFTSEKHVDNQTTTSYKLHKLSYKYKLLLIFPSKKVIPLYVRFHIYSSKISLQPSAVWFFLLSVGYTRCLVQTEHLWVLFCLFHLMRFLYLLLRWPWAIGNVYISTGFNYISLFCFFFLQKINFYILMCEELPLSVIQACLPGRSVRYAKLFICLVFVRISSESVSFVLCLVMNFSIFDKVWSSTSKHNEKDYSLFFSTFNIIRGCIRGLVF